MHSFEIRGIRIALAIVASIFLLTAPALGDDRPWEQTRWRTLNLGKNFIFSIQGPLIAEWAPGLAFEVRF